MQCISGRKSRRSSEGNETTVLSSSSNAVHLGTPAAAASTSSSAAAPATAQPKSDMESKCKSGKKSTETRERRESLERRLDKIDYLLAALGNEEKKRKGETSTCGAVTSSATGPSTPTASSKSAPARDRCDRVSVSSTVPSERNVRGTFNGNASESGADLAELSSLTRTTTIRGRLMSSFSVGKKGKTKTTATVTKSSTSEGQMAGVQHRCEAGAYGTTQPGGGGTGGWSKFKVKDPAKPMHDIAASAAL